MLRGVFEIVERAQTAFHTYRERVDAERGITRDRYIRPLRTFLYTGVASMVAPATALATE